MSKPIALTTRAAIARCKGHLSARATAATFGVKEGLVKGIWQRGSGLPAPALRWRCGCGAIATGDVCGCGAPSAWYAADQRTANEIAALGEEGW